MPIAPVAKSATISPADDRRSAIPRLSTPRAAVFFENLD